MTYFCDRDSSQDSGGKYVPSIRGEGEFSCQDATHSVLIYISSIPIFIFTIVSVRRLGSMSIWLGQKVGFYVQSFSAWAALWSYDLEPLGRRHRHPQRCRIHRRIFALPPASHPYIA